MNEVYGPRALTEMGMEFERAIRRDAETPRDEIARQIIEAHKKAAQTGQGSGGQV